LDQHRPDPIALAIAVVAFADRPLIALALVVGQLIELPILAIVSQALPSVRRRCPGHDRKGLAQAEKRGVAVNVLAMVNLPMIQRCQRLLDLPDRT
jgi:hypothetical protein